MSDARLPNFFILGAPKSGTTSLYEYLRTHPNVFMPHIKEPHFFASDFSTYRTVQSRTRYLDLFAGAAPEHAARGEASVFYLYSKAAVPEILQSNPAAKLIAILRNPVELVYSLHSQYVYGFDEDEKDFERAWSLQQARARGDCIPAHCVEPVHLQYAAVGRLGEQIARLFATAAREQVKVLLFDDLAADPQAVYRDVLRFLGLPGDGRTEFPVINENHIHRREWLSKLVMHPPFPLNAVKRTLKRTFGLHNTRLGRAFYRRNLIRTKRSPLDPRTRALLVDAFADDIRLLGTLLDRNLDHWCDLEPGTPAIVASRRGQSAG